MDAGFFSDRVASSMIYNWAVSFVLSTFNFSCYIFEELEICHLGLSMTDFPYMDKNIIKNNLGNARYGMILGCQNNESFWHL